ncbi:DUF6471 domain-containing protein [Paraburkholderia sediminicola]|uniref:DUF6471 domain-containing protein n=1 Tax=Paraburkholderia sediminicola TaxID=458836 RepID=UPI0038B94339
MPTSSGKQGADATNVAEIDFAAAARRILKSVLRDREITYAELAAKLSARGIIESETSIAQKLRRGTFQFSFFLQCMSAIGMVQVNLTVPSPESETTATIR